MDMKYTHIPGYGWQYAVTVIDYYSRCLLAWHFRSVVTWPAIDREVEYWLPHLTRC